MQQLNSGVDEWVGEETYSLPLKNESASEHMLNPGICSQYQNWIH